jgi:hypothetical protein
MNYKPSELYDRRWRKNAFKLVQYWIVFAIISVNLSHQLKSSHLISSHHYMAQHFKQIDPDIKKVCRWVEQPF